MKTSYSVKNFRVFDEKGASFELDPITIVTGCNSSGKSSLVKSICLADSFISQINELINEKNASDNNIDLKNIKLDFKKYPNSLLGNFKLVLNNEAQDNNISIEYKTYSRMLSKDIKVLLVFSQDDDDALWNGYLKSLTLYIDDKIFYNINKNNIYENCLNLSLVFDSFLNYVPLEFVLHNLLGLIGQYNIEGTVSDDEFEMEKQKHISLLKQCDKKLLKDVINYIRFSRNKFSQSIIHSSGFNPGIIDWTQKHNSLFYIPLIEKFDELGRENIESYIDELLSNKNNDSLFYASKKVVHDFLESDSNSFADYFHKYESNFLDNIYNCTKIQIPFNSFSLFGPNSMKIDQTYLISYPGYFKTIDLMESHINKLSEGKLFEKKDKKQKIKEWENRPLDFSILYEILMDLNHLYDEKDCDYYSYNDESFFNPFRYYEHNVYSLLISYASLLIREVFLNKWNIIYASSSRPLVKRLYSLEDNDDFSRLLQEYFDAKRNFLQKSDTKRPDYVPDSFMNKWISKLTENKYKSIDILPTAEGLGVIIKISKNDNGKDSRLLADEGYGLTHLFAVLLKIETEILRSTPQYANNLYGLDELDNYDSSKFHFESRTVAIEEPEIHLHPALQAKLIDLFIDAYKNYKINFIVETHSEYLIRKLQYLVYDKKIDSNDISIIYIDDSDVTRRSDPTDPYVKNIRIDKDGKLSDSFGKGFFDEADKWVMKLFN